MATAFNFAIVAVIDIRAAIAICTMHDETRYICWGGGTFHLDEMILVFCKFLILPGIQPLVQLSVDIVPNDMGRNENIDFNGIDGS